MKEHRMPHKVINAIGYASDIAGPHSENAAGPLTLKNSSELAALSSQGIIFDWQVLVQPDSSLPSTLRKVQRLAEQMSLLTVNAVLQNQFFLVLGGDHTSAIGTWSGVYHAKHKQGPMGLIWID